MGGVALSLDICSSYDEKTTVNLKSITFPDGAVEYTISPIYPPDPEREQVNSAPGDGDPKEKDNTRNIFRAKSMLRKCMKTAQSRFLLTTTTRANITDYNISRAQITKFLRLNRYHYPDQKYMGVAEQQKRGAWHWHLALTHRQDARLTRKLWLQACGGDGNIDLQELKTQIISRYCAKYLGKDFHKIPPGTPRYIRSRNIRLNEETTKYENLEIAFKFIAGLHPDWTGEHFVTDSGAIWLTSENHTRNIT